MPVKTKPTKLRAIKKINKRGRPAKAIEMQSFQRTTGRKAREGIRKIGGSNGGIIIPGEENLSQSFDSGQEGPDLQIETNIAKGIRSEGNVVAKDKDVVGQSTTEGLVNRGAVKANELAIDIETRWREKEKQHSKTFYRCPMCKPGDQIDFDTPGKVRKHISAEHPQQLKAYKLQKADPARYEPVQHVVSPKRTLEDLVPSSQVERMKSLQKSHAAMQAVSKSAQRMSNQAMKASALIAKPEGMAVSEAQKLSDPELLTLFRLAYSRGKRDLIRKVRSICRERGLALPY
jgi:hypothetical protein